MMKKLRVIVAGVLTLGITLSVIAGPDFQAIEQGRKTAQARTAAEKGCESKRLVLPLDHGPRATSTPYLNKLRKERFEAEMKACKEAAVKRNDSAR